MIYLVVILFLLSAIAKSFCDRIRFKGNFKSDWMVGAGKYHHSKRTWLMKYPLSFLSDGWHFFDAIRVMMVCIFATLLLGLAIWYAIGFYIIHGLIFETFYKIK